MGSHNLRSLDMTPILTLLLLLIPCNHTYHLPLLPSLYPLHPLTYQFPPFWLLNPGLPQITHEFRCPNQGRFPSSEDCTHFFECAGEDQLLGKSTCPPGTLFEPASGECMPKDQASCTEFSEDGVEPMFRII